MQQQENSPYRELYLSAAFLVVVAVCLHFFFFSRGFYAVSWDESGRTLDAYSWARHGIAQTPEWLPFYRVLVGFGLIAFPDLFFTPRIICFVFGLAVIPAAAWLAEEAFQSRKATLMTLLLVTLAPQRISLSLAPLSEIIFTFVILVAIAFFARWTRTNASRSLVLSALFASLAGAVRYEGWLFGAAIFAAMEIYRWRELTRVSGRERLFAGALLFAFPVAWSAGTLLREVTTVMDQARQYSAWQILIRNPAIAFLIDNATCLNLIGVLVLFRLLRGASARHRALVAVTFAPLLATSLILLLTRATATGASWRITAVWSILLLPFTAYLLTDLWSAANGIRKAAAYFVVLVVLSAFLLQAFRIERASTWSFPRSDREAGAYLNQWLTKFPHAKIVIDASTYAFLNIEVAAQHPDSFLLNSPAEQQRGPRILAPGNLDLRSLQTRDIQFLVFASDGYKSFLNQSAQVSKLGDFGAWSIYRIDSF